MQDAIDNGMKRERHGRRLAIDVVIYLSVNAVAWVLHDGDRSAASRGVGQERRARRCASISSSHLTALSLRYFSEQRAGWIIARLTSDVDAVSDVLSQGLTTLVVEHR